LIVGETTPCPGGCDHGDNEHRVLDLAIDDSNRRRTATERRVRAQIYGRRRWCRTHDVREPVEDGHDVYGAEAQATASRAAKKTWRRRLSRARHTKHTQRATIPFEPLPFGQGPAIGLYDREDDYPKITRAPWSWP
jgi:hypothetical protein